MNRRERHIRSKCLFFSKLNIELGKATMLCLVLLFALMTSCGDSKRKAYEEAIVEWTGKEILFPDSMRLVGGGMIAKPEADFTIVSYYDSVGCAECKLRLSLHIQS